MRRRLRKAYFYTVVAVGIAAAQGLAAFADMRKKCQNTRYGTETDKKG